MTQTYNFAQLQEEAKAEGFSTELVPDGTYLMQAAHVNVSSSQGGKDQIGVMWKVLEGACANASGWDNQTISPENPKAMGFFFRFCAQFGLDGAFFSRQPQPSLAEIASLIENTVATVKVGHRTWKQRPGATGTPKVTNTFTIEQLHPAGTAPQTPVAAPVAAPVPQPQFQAPVQQAAPVPLQQPVAPAAPVYAPPAAPQPVYAPAPEQAVQYAPAPPVQLQQPQNVTQVPGYAGPVPGPAPEAPIDPATGLPVRSF